MYRHFNGDSADAWSGWEVIAAEPTLEEMRAKIKTEIYAELAELKAGIVVPVLIK